MLYPDELQALKPKHAVNICAAAVLVESGRGREIRTPDILLPKQTRYQTALYPDFSPSCERRHHTERNL
jgi:hypothetical protein